jgi:hypothetical protein
VRGRVGKNVRVSADEFLGNREHHVAEIEGALFFRNAGMEHDLKQKVAKLILEIGDVAAGNRVGNLIGYRARWSKNSAPNPMGSRFVACAAPT